MEPQRTCIGCRQRGDKSSLVRLVFSPQRAGVVIDHAQRLPGRGCSVHSDCVEVALQRHAVGRALRTTVDPDQVARELSGLRAGPD